jgi:signal transduction histidine kinase/ligand-binding sensor domain-containing protein
MALVCTTSAYALDPHKAITQFVHTAWTGQDGAPSNIQALAQTTDGYLWLGTATGLFRFDGVRFTHFESTPGEDLPDASIRALLATRDGALWIVPRTSRIFRFSNGHVTPYSEPEGLPRTRSLVEGPDGALIAATDKGLRQFKDGSWKDIGKEWNYPARSALQLYFDKAGDLWVVTEDRVVCHRPGQDQFVDPGEPVVKNPGVYTFGESSDSIVWLSESERSAHTLKPPDSNGASKDRYRFTEVHLGTSSVLFDRDGSLWIGSMGDGLRRVAFPKQIQGRSIGQFGREAEEFTRKNGLSADWIGSTLEDREGNIWFGTDRGLDRFHDGAFTPVSIPEGDLPRAILAATDGNLWTAALNRPTLLRIGPDRQEAIKSPDTGNPVFAEEPGIVWLTNGNGLTRREKGRLVQVHLPGFTPTSVCSITRDREGGLWLFDQKEGLLRVSNGVVTDFNRDSGIGSRLGVVFADRRGRVWISDLDQVIVYQDGKFRTFGSGDGLPPGRVSAFLEDSGGDVWTAGDGGLSVFLDGRFHALSRPNGFAARSAFGIADDGHGDWWISSDAGVLRVSFADLRMAATDPAHRVRFRRFDTLDGLPGKPRLNFPFPVMSRTTDGRIWVETIDGIAFVDPGHIPKNTIPPPVHVEAVRVDGKPLAPADGIAFAHGTNEIEIDYTALSLSIPERVLFRYKLEGADDDWYDAGATRQASYKHLRPKHYRFRVLACNSDGVWNEVGAEWNFRITPAFYQTVWFYAACAGLGIYGLWTLYQLRIRQIAARMNAGFDERSAERGRLAVELHDTILQTVQAAKMIADNARYSHSGDPVRLHEAVESVSDWLAQAVNEGRAALNALHTSTTRRNDLAEAFQRAAEGHKNTSSMRFVLSVEGAPQNLHPIVRDEIYCIGSEAIRNAYLHSGADELEVTLSYARNLTVRVRDNGRGIDPDVVSDGKPGHFGLRGMQERAIRIQATLRLASRPGTGTELELTVPGRTVYRKPESGRTRWRTRLRSIVNWRNQKGDTP